MPGGDGTGPLGTGGKCTPYGVGGQNTRPPGFGCGFGRGFRRGMGRRFGGMPYMQGATPGREEELQILAEESSFLETRLDEIKKRLEALNRK